MLKLVICLTVVFAAFLTPPAASAQSLTAQQEADLKTMTEHVDTMESEAQVMVDLLAGWEKTLVLPQAEQATFNKSGEAFRAAFAELQALLRKLPIGNAKVAEQWRRAKAAGNLYNQTVEQGLPALSKKMNEAAAEADPNRIQGGANGGGNGGGGGGGGDINADMKRLRDIAYTFVDFEEQMAGRPKEAFESLKVFQPAVGELNAFAQKYASTIESNVNVREPYLVAKNRLEKVPGLARGMVGQVAERASAGMDRAESLTEEAIREEWPGQFLQDGQVTKTMEDVETEMRLVAAIDSGKLPPLAERFRGIKAKAAEAQKQLQSKIIAASRAPDDKYTALDGEQLKAGVREVFERLHPEKKIVDIRLPKKKWDRKQVWEIWRDELTFRDYSENWAMVVFEGKSETGSDEYHMLPIGILKNHRDGDKLDYDPNVLKPLEELELRFRMLPENL